MSRPFRKGKRGIRVGLTPQETSVLGSILSLLAGVDPDEPAFARLTPSPYPSDAQANAEFRRLVSDQLEEVRQGDRGAFSASLEGDGWLSEEEAEAWLRVLGEGRLVLATRLGIEEDGWEEEADPADPRVSLLHYLGWLQEELTEVLAADSP